MYPASRLSLLQQGEWYCGVFQFIQVVWGFVPLAAPEGPPHLLSDCFRVQSGWTKKSPWYGFFLFFKDPRLQFNFCSGSLKQFNPLQA